MVKQTRHNYTLGNQQQNTYLYMKNTLVTDSTFIVKQTHRNYTLGNQQQYTCTNM